MANFNLHDALLYDQLEDERVRCNLCAHRCTINEGGKGICRVRENHEGRLYTRVYGNLIAENVDPIEKKPLYHFNPGSKAYSMPHQAAISIVNGAKTGRSHRCHA